MMIEMNKAVVPGQMCLTRSRDVPNPNKAAAGCRLRNLVHVVGKGKLGGNIFSSSPPQLVAAVTIQIGIPIPIPRRRRLMATSNSNSNDYICPFIPSSSSYGDPCQDLFFNALRITQPCLKYLKQLLPLAWSHNPLTTLKLIFSANPDGFAGIKFDMAVLWLHHNHPKTLLRNVHSLVNINSVSFGQGAYTLVQILSNLLVQKRGGQDNEAAAHLHHLHPERYDLDPDYRLLHDRVIDIFVELLKSDIDKMKQHKLKLKPFDYLTDGDDRDDHDQLDVDRLVSTAARCCTDKRLEEGHRVRTIFLCESIGMRLFPPELDQSQEWEQLRKEVLVPLTEYYDLQWRQLFAADSYHGEAQECRVVKKYLEELKAATAAGGGNLKGGIIQPDALLPNEIIKFVEKEDVREAAELQWKAMVEYIKQGEGLGKFKNCLVVGYYVLDYEDEYPEESYAEAGLEILVSEVSEEPWKGKMIKYSGGRYQLDFIQGHDLTSKFEFMRTVRTSFMDFKEPKILEVFDLILEVAVNENLKAEHMIKKVIVFTEDLEPPDSRIWDVQYDALRNTFEAIRSKFRDKGYGDDLVPHILYFNEGEQPWIRTEHPGFTLLSGFSHNMFKSFLKNGGEIGPHHLMEAAIAHEEYQTLEELIKDQVANMYLWPKTLEVPIMDPAKAFNRPVGILHVKVLRAMKFKKKDLLGASDPYVKLKLPENNLPSHKTSVKHKNLNPEWNEEFNIVVKDAQSQALELLVYDWEKVGKHEKMGMNVVPLKDLPKDEPKVLT